MKKSQIKFLCFAFFFALASCSSLVSEKPDYKKTEADSSIKNNYVIDSLILDSNQLSKALLTKIYTKAIKDFMEAILLKDKTSFDTLFIGHRKLGQPDDFPDITLPERIDHTTIILLSIAESHSNKKSFYKKNSPMINLMGWVDKVKAEFVFVTFFPEFKHQYDCYMNYSFNSKSNEYELVKQTSEVLIYNKNGNPDHFAIFEGKKHIGYRSAK